MSYGEIVICRETRKRFVNVIQKADSRVLISLGLLVKGDDETLRLEADGDVITIDAENGMLKYEIVTFDPGSRALVCDLIFSTVPGIEV